MILIDLITLVGAAIAVVACVCRLDKLQFRHHQPVVIIMHGALGVGCAASGMQAWNHQAGLLEVSTVTAALAWLWISLPSWKSGPPRHVETRPAPLDSRPLP